jgi:hypothetical protein
MEARCCEIMVEDLRSLVRKFAGCKGPPMAMILDSRTLRSAPESGECCGYNGAERGKGLMVQAAVNELDHLLALHPTAPDEQNRALLRMLAETVARKMAWNVPLGAKEMRPVLQKVNQHGTRRARISEHHDAAISPRSLP